MQIIKNKLLTFSAADRLDVLLCAHSSISEQDLKDLLVTHDFKEVEVNIAKVSTYAPLNRQQYEEWTKSWPLSYREDTRLDPKFTQEDIDIIHGHIREILSNNSTIVCRIVDPSSNKIKAEGCDTREEHPLHHAVMNSVNIVAQKENELAGGVGRMKRTANQMTGGDNIEEQNQTEEITPKTGYLCTGYDIYITHEPCAM